MLKVLRNLKKSMISVIFIILLLCVQAWADLTLPDYTSKIVNVGIQARWYRKCCTRGNSKVTDGNSFVIYKRGGRYFK